MAKRTGIKKAPILLIFSFLLFSNTATAGWYPMVTATQNALLGVWGSSATDVFAVGMGGTILHYDGTKWLPMTSGTTKDLNAVWGSSGSDVFAVGADGTILHYDGTSWSSMSSGTTYSLTCVWGSSATDVWADGMVFSHYDGSTWTQTNLATGSQDIWGTSGSNIYAAGDNGGIVHYDSLNWSGMTTPVSNILYGIWGSSNSDIFAVGHYGTIIHYNGTAWSSMNSGSTIIHYWDVWGSAWNDVWAVGGGGVILHYGGNKWTADTSGTSKHLYGIWGASSSQVFVVGSQGTILRYSATPLPPIKDAVPDIKVNGSDGPVSILPTTSVNVTVSLDSGDYASQNADWWLGVVTPFGPYSFVFPHGIIWGVAPLMPGPILDIAAPLSVMNGALPPGQYEFLFGVDYLMNGVLDPAELFQDSVSVTVSSPAP